MKTLRSRVARFLIACLCLTLSLLAGCSTTAQKDAHTDNPEVILAQAKKAYYQQKYQEVFQLMFPLAVAGNDQAQYVLGYLYHNGLGVEKNDQQAMNWIQRAASQGNKKALEALR